MLLPRRVAALAGDAEHRALGLVAIRRAQVEHGLDPGGVALQAARRDRAIEIRLAFRVGGSRADDPGPQARPPGHRQLVQLVADPVEVALPAPPRADDECD